MTRPDSPPRGASRREVLSWALGAAGIAALGPIGGRIREARAGGPGDPFFVLVYLDGGCDTLNAVVPRTLPSYFSRRPTLAIPDSASLPLTGGPGTSLYRLHPALPRLKDAWDAGEVALVHRVGYPTENLSHFESQDIYSTAVRAGTQGFLCLGIPHSGWVARYAERNAPTPLGAVSIGMGRPAAFVGGTVSPLQVESLESFRFQEDWHYPWSHVQRMRTARAALDLVADDGAPGAVKGALAQAHDLSGQVEAALLAHETHLARTGLSFPDTTLGHRLRDMAALVHGGFDTRVFLTGTGGFDTHGDQGALTGRLPDLLAEIDGALDAFARDMRAIGRWSDAVVCVFTEFGRRNYENGSTGTDHGAAYSAILAGGPVAGGSYGPDPTDVHLQDEYLPYAVDFRDLFREVVADHLDADPGPVFPEAQPTNDHLGFL